MTDYSWLEPIQRETERIKKETEHIREENKRLMEETEQIKEETERLREENKKLSKINVKEEFGHIADGFLLSEKEINELRESKRELTEYAREKLKELSNGELINSEESQKNYYNYRVIDYCATGEGRTIFLQIYRNDSNDYYEKRWRQFVGVEFYLPGTEELSEREFLDKYSRFLPNVVAHKLRDRSLTIWETQVHFNYG